MFNFPLLAVLGGDQLTGLAIVFVYVVYRLAKDAQNKNRNRQYSDSISPDKISRHVSDKFRRAWTGRFQNLPAQFYGKGCNRDFKEYLEGNSWVPVKNINDIANWLLGCTYTSDLSHKGVRDYWQHPRELEATRKGDCEDFALWAWRKLIELNVQCEFMVGRWVRGEQSGAHAWVLLIVEDQPIIFETTGTSRKRMFKSLEMAATEYVPFASIDHKVRKKAYIGIANRILRLMKK